MEVRRWRPLGIFWSQVLRRGHGVTEHVTSQSRGLCRTGVVMCYGGRQLAATRQIVRGEAMMVLAPRTRCPGILELVNCNCF